jgi:hypothetical protein
MKQDKLSAFLGRPLTPIESSNFDLYLKLARESLEGMLCTVLCDTDDPKFYESRDGYSTVFTDIFTDIDEVKVDGDVIDPEKYTVRQWDRRNATWFNSIVFDEKLCGEEVEVSASWGFAKMPADLQYMLAGLFGLVTKKNTSDSSIQSKQVEDFRITFNADADASQEFADKYRSVIQKYSLCDVGNVQHGKVCEWNLYY